MNFYVSPELGYNISTIENQCGVPLVVIFPRLTLASTSRMLEQCLCYGIHNGHDE